jgi:hypothetical protein
VPLTNGSGSGSCYFRHWPSRRQQKTNFSSYYIFDISLFAINKRGYGTGVGLV